MLRLYAPANCKPLKPGFEVSANQLSKPKKSRRGAGNLWVYRVMLTAKIRTGNNAELRRGPHSNQPGIMLIHRPPKLCLFRKKPGGLHYRTIGPRPRSIPAFLTY